MKITLTFTSANAQRAIRQLRDRVPAAAARALNRAGASMRTHMVRAVKDDLGVPTSAARDQVFSIEAIPGRLRFELRATRKRWPLSEFNVKGELPSRGRGRVTAKIGKTRKRYPNAFMARMKSGHVGVFKREGNSKRKSVGAWGPNLSITELHGPSVGHVFEKHAAASLARGEEQLLKNLQHELRFALQSLSTS